MRVLLVTEESISQSILEQARRQNMQLFHYSHPLKAMDNLEEIQPDIIVWNVDDFPRHWKVCRALTLYNPMFANIEFYLMSNSPGDEEQEQQDEAEALGIEGIVHGGFGSEDFLLILSDAGGPVEVQTRAILAPERSGEIFWLNPDTRKIARGTATLHADSMLYIQASDHGSEKLFREQSTLVNAKFAESANDRLYLLNVKMKHEAEGSLEGIVLSETLSD